MSFRNFDNRDRYYDLQGNPLAGCVQFMLKDGNTVAPIFDMDQVPISNPQITDILGRTDQQVFIDTDVVAYMYKYVGTGTLAEEEALGIDTSDQSKWALQYTVESAAIDIRSITGESAMDVPDIDSLRALDVQEVPEVYGHKIITLDGYYEAGDCEPMKYVWDGESTLNDDNGSVIAPDGVLTGRWILVQPTEHCDSRHFGIFPQDSADSEVDHSTRITQLLAYCNTRSIRPYFNGSVSYPYFIYTSVAYNSRNTIDVSNDTQFVDRGSGNRFYGQWNGNPYFVNANTNVNSKVVRHSWHFKGYDYGTVTYIVDSRWSPVLLSHIQVEIELPPATGSQFNDCDIVSNEMFTDNVVLENLEVHTDWFDDDYDWAKLSLNGCTIRLQNCKDANTYVLLKNKQNEADYGDLGEQTLSNATLLADCIAENAVFENVTLTGNTELHNVSGSVTLNGSAYQLNFIDCWLYISNASPTAMGNVQWRRGSMSGASSMQVINTLYLDNVNLSMPLVTRGANASIRDSEINGAITCTDISVERSTINAAINQFQNASTNKVNVDITYCLFNGPNGIHNLSSTTPGAQVLGRWLNNDAKGENDYRPIAVDLLYILSNDMAHIYTYEGNTGRFLPRMPRVTYTQNEFWYIAEVVRNLERLPPFTLVSPELVLQPTHSPWFTGIQISSNFAQSVPFFAIGTATAAFKITVTYYFTNTTEMNDSMTPRVETHAVSESVSRFITTDNAAIYNCSDFAGMKFGSIQIGPKNFTYPAKITTRDPSTWPTTNSAVITIERIR